MPIDTIESLLHRPRIRLEELCPADQSLCFIIDQSRQPEALRRLYGLGQPLEQQNLFQGTEFSALADKGPVWVSAPETTELQALAAELCQRNAGICLLTGNVQQAIAHARWLLKADDGSGGQSLLSFYRPSLWAALVTNETPCAQLMGPWASVFTPAPRHFGGTDGDWLAWPGSQGSLSPPAPGGHFRLPPAAAARNRTLGWLYWLDEEYETFGAPAPASLPSMVDNLAVLARHSIHQARHLRTLADLVSGPPIQDRPEAMVILASNLLAHQKTDQLRTLATRAPLREQDQRYHHGT